MFLVNHMHEDGELREFMCQEHMIEYVNNWVTFGRLWFHTLVIVRVP